MPNAKILEQKKATVASLCEKIQNAAGGVIVDYKGISVADDTALRRKLREDGVEYAVVKNTLLRFAFDNTGLGELDPQLNGSTAIAIASDPVAAAKILSEYSTKTKEAFKIKGGFVDGKVIDKEGVKALAELPPRDPHCYGPRWLQCSDHRLCQRAQRQHSRSRHRSQGDCRQEGRRGCLRSANTHLFIGGN